MAGDYSIIYNGSTTGYGPFSGVETTGYPMVSPYTQQIQQQQFGQSLSQVSFIARVSVQITEKKFIIIEASTGAVVASAETIEDADQKAETLAAENDKRYIVFRPVFVREPEKKTRRREITL